MSRTTRQRAPRWPRHRITCPKHRWPAHGLGTVPVAFALLPSSPRQVRPSTHRRAEREDDADLLRIRLRLLTGSVEPGLGPRQPSRRSRHDHTIKGNGPIGRCIGDHSANYVDAASSPPLPISPPVSRRDCLTAGAASSSARGADYDRTTQPHTIAAVLSKDRVGFDSHRQPT